MTTLRRWSHLAVVATWLVATPAFSQERMSLVERMNQMEAQIAALNRTGNPAGSQAGSQANVELLNKLTQMQGEVKALRSQLELMQNENGQLKQRSRDQYTDIDSRLAKLEGGGVVAAPVAGAAPAPAGGFSDVAAETNVATEASAYEEAYRTLIDRGEAAEAARLFQVFLKQYPNGTLVANAWYWLGESYYVTQNYPLALESFQMVIGKFPESRKMPDAMLKAGYCQIELKQFGEGLATLNRLITNYPGHPASEMAISRLRGLSLDQQR